VALRIEDLDGPRVKRGADLAAVEDLRWLGLDWDEGPVYQSARTDLYRKAAEKLLAAGHAYPCVCSRKEVELAASAPHAEDGSAVYPGTCRDRFAGVAPARLESGRDPALRFRVPEAPRDVVEWTDCFRGQERFEVARQLGDFLIAKADGTAAYQLAVVVDDAAMGATDVVRGDDLVDSTPRQVLLYRALGLGEHVPDYYHLPLVIGSDGRRLAKRHGDTRISFYREKGVPPERLRALMARWCGVEADPQRATMEELLAGFRLDSLPREPVVFNAADDRWLRAGGAVAS
jgi:glutamyl-tRNA synthetase